MNNDTSSLKDDLAMNNVAATDSVAAAPGLMDEGTPAKASGETTEAVDPAYADEQADPVLSAGTAEDAARAAEASVAEAPQAAEASAAVEAGVPPMASGISDDMSFAQAFAAARAQVGAGGAFEWHGQVYGTYYKNEWDAMSTQERHDFQVAAIRGSHSDASAHNSGYAGTSHHAQGVVDDGSTGKYSYEQQDEAGRQDVVQVDTVDDDEVRILGLESVQDEDGNTINIAAFDINGERAMLVDIDNDRVMDVLVHDDNGDGQISEDEMEDVSSYNITVDDVQARMQQDGGTVTAQEYASEDVAQADVAPGYGQDFANDDIDMADFDNNADVSDFV